MLHLLLLSLDVTIRTMGVFLFFTFLEKEKNETKKWKNIAISRCAGS